MSEKDKMWKKDKKAWAALDKKQQKIFDHIETAIAEEGRRVKRLEDDHAIAIEEDKRRSENTKEARVDKKHNNLVARIETRLSAQPDLLQKRKDILQRVNDHIHLSLQHSRASK
jgi:hypothetical protein